ncbi:MAG: hypothetical protein WBP34_05600 [Thermoanaerobaculia bacterium]
MTDKRRGKVGLVLHLCLWLVGRLATAQPAPEAVEVVHSQSDDSSWTLEVEPEAHRILARLDDGAVVALEIDYDGSGGDEHLVGITPIIGGRRLEGAFWGSTAPLIYPQLDPEEHRLERLGVHARSGALRVRFEGGTYRILDPVGPEEPLFMEAIFRRQNDRLVVNLYGLYYLLPSQAGTRLDLTAAGERLTRTVEAGGEEGTSLVLDGSAAILTVSDDESRHLEYFDRVTRVEIDDSRFGRMELETYVERLQLQVNRQPGVAIELFELDFDHTFKDRGQRRVMSRLSIDLP